MAVIETLSVDTLYRVRRTRGDAMLEVFGGSVDVYGSCLNDASAPDNMSVTFEDFTGIDGFYVLPEYLYMKSNSGTPTIKLVGCNAEVVE